MSTILKDMTEGFAAIGRRVAASRRLQCAWGWAVYLAVVGLMALAVGC